jgi:hypothetical protein
MILLFALTRPYKDKIVNSFSIMNETFLFIEGCYLFIFLDSNLDEST